MTVYLRRRPLSLLLVVHANIPLRLPLRNAIRRSTIHQRSIAVSTPLIPAKAIEGVGGLLLLRLQCCTVAAAVVSHERFCTITMTTAAVLLYKCRTVPRATIGAASVLLLRTPVGTVAVVATVWPQLLCLRTQQILRWWMIVLLNLSLSTSIKERPSLLIMCYHLDRLIS